MLLSFLLVVACIEWRVLQRGDVEESPAAGSSPSGPMLPASANTQRLEPSQCGTTPSVDARRVEIV
jgi:hypothetical protein